MRRTAALIVALILSISLWVAPAQAQDSFPLQYPLGNVLIRDLSTELTLLTWTPLPAATQYRVYLFYVSGNSTAPRFGTVIDEVVPTTNCTTTPLRCFYALTPSERAAMERGEYAWTVEATTPSGTVEASNGAAFFNYNPNEIQFLLNGGFETGLSPWVGINLTADTVIVDPAIANTGSASFLFRGSATELSKIVQRAEVAYYNIRPGDDLTLSLTYLTTGATVSSYARVTMYYNDGTPQSIQRIDLAPQAAYTTVNTSLTINGRVRRVRVELFNRSLRKNDRVRLDDIALTLAGSAAPRSATPELLPFPVR
ncbi:MAG: hypothetical protein MUF38_01170 [Anaerolineae bacterium]|jgi:hypothetical protein|nr:hypothetical protein [Anaerolineae bacterium]